MVEFLAVIAIKVYDSALKIRLKLTFLIKTTAKSYNVGLVLERLRACLSESGGSPWGMGGKKYESVDK